VYRVISIPGKLKLATITAPFSGNLDSLERVDHALKSITLSVKSRFSKLSRFPSGILQLETASPSSKVSWIGVINDGLSL